MRRFPSPSHTLQKMAKKRSGNPRKRKPKKRTAKSNPEKQPRPQPEKEYDRNFMLERIAKAMSKHNKELLDCFLYSLCVMKVSSERGKEREIFFDEILNRLFEIYRGNEIHLLELFLEYKKMKQDLRSREKTEDDASKEMLQSEEEAVTILEDTATKLLELDIQDREISPSK